MICRHYMRSQRRKKFIHDEKLCFLKSTILAMVPDWFKDSTDQPEPAELFQIKSFSVFSSS